MVLILARFFQVLYFKITSVHNIVLGVQEDSGSGFGLKKGVVVFRDDFLAIVGKSQSSIPLRCLRVGRLSRGKQMLGLGENRMREEFHG